MIILSVPLVDAFPYIETKRVRCDAFEVRLDYLDNTSNIPANNNISLLKAIAEEKNLPLIFTLREKNEGGMNTYTPSQKIELLTKLGKQPDTLIDYELDFLLRHRPEIAPEKLIVSKHIHSKDNSAVISSVNQAIAQASRFFPHYIKIVMPVNSYSDMDSLLSIDNKSNVSLILQGTGMLGKLFRILKLINRDGGHYIALNDRCRTAEEQLTPEIVGLFNHLLLKKDFILGGIIGGEQVVDSYGIMHYNSLFRKKKLNAVYLPFPVKDFNDFFGWISGYADKDRLYGFSVTMPHKKQISSYLRVEGKKVNLISLIPRSECKNGNRLPAGRPEYLLNTDEDAFKAALRLLKMKKNETILIIGYGAVAELALELLQSFRQVYLTGRNEGKGTQLAQRYKRSFIPLEKVKDAAYDLLVNCTPVGMKDENLLTLTGSFPFKKAIDLPYGNNETPLMIYCREHNLPSVNGKQFWQLQAVRQSKIFLDNLRTTNH